MKVQPITDPKDIRKIKKVLSDNPRNLLLFTMGINTGLRTQDLLALRVGQVRDTTVGDRVVIVEKKTGKENVFMINKEIRLCLDKYLSTRPDAEDDQYLFISRKYWNSPLSVYAVTHYVQDWCDSINLKGNYGAHSMRKTWAYQMRQLGVTISKRLNHSNPAVTLRYLCIQEEEVEAVLMKCI